jgi:hypothetical protein
MTSASDKATTPSHKQFVTQDSANVVTTELRDKIKSKMDVTKFFAAAISLLIGILMKEGQTTSVRSRIGLIFFVSSLGFCIAAMTAYDHLLWPKQFLIKSDEMDSDEAFNRKMREALLRSWCWLFVPAVLYFGIGFFLFLSQAIGLMPWPVSPLVQRWHLLGVLLLFGFATPMVALVATWPFRSNHVGTSTNSKLPKTSDGKEI